MKTDYLPGTEFTLVQQDDMYHFNSDTVLLGRFMKAKQKDSVLDIGCASGALLLYASLHHPRQITGIDLFEEVLDQARLNLERNHVQAELVCTRVQDYKPTEQFDVIVCNPPYFDTENEELISTNPYLACARHEANLTMDELFRNVRRLLRTNGHFYLVHRASRLNELHQTSSAYGLQAVTMIPVYKNRTSGASGVLLEYCFGKKRQLRIGQPVYLNDM